MKTIPLKSHLKDLAANDKIGNAIDLTLNWSRENNENDLENNFIHLKSRFTSFKNSNAGETIEKSEFDRGMNKIKQAFLSYIEDISSTATIRVEERSEPSPQPLPPNGTPSSTTIGGLKILMLTANPSGMAKLNLDREYARISEKLQTKQDKFNLIVKKAVNKTEFREFTEIEKPNILHFSGHNENGESGGILLQDEEKREYEVVPTATLDILFKYFNKKFKIQTVVLNACVSEEQAIVIAKHVPYVIGTTISIKDSHAASFSAGFYFTLSESGDNIVDAFETGKIEAVLGGASESDFIIYKDGVKLIL